MDYRKLHWSSDWNGDEVGYDDIPVVGLYSIADFPEVHVYIDTETGKILEAWAMNDDE